jgi:hypothetical protein
MGTRKPNNSKDQGRRVLGRSIARASFPVPPSVDELTTGYPILLDRTGSSHFCRQCFNVASLLGYRACDSYSTGK